MNKAAEKEDTWHNMFPTISLIWLQVSVNPNMQLENALFLQVFSKPSRLCRAEKSRGLIG